MLRKFLLKTLILADTSDANSRKQYSINVKVTYSVSYTEYVKYDAVGTQGLDKLETTTHSPYTRASLPNM